MSSMYFLVGIAFAVVAAIIARGKGRNTVGWFLVGLVVGPFALISVVLPARVREGYSAECPACCEVIAAEATVCRYCRTQLQRDQA